MKVLVTGGLGFIGCNIALKCMSLGWDVTIVDSGKTEYHEKRRLILRKAGTVKIHFQDLRRYVITSKFDDFDVVFHQAALPSVLYSVEKPYVSFRNNVQDTTVLMLDEARRGRNIGRIVFASSAAVYGNSKVLPVTEDSPKVAESPYGLQKYICEQLLELNSRTSDVDSVSLRYFNAYGPYQYNKGVYATAVSCWLNAIKDGEPLRKDGTGEQSRDMVFVDDIVNANILAATCKKNLNGIALNIASGVEISNNEILDMLKSRFKFDIKQAPFREGDIMRTRASIDLAKEVIGYQPMVSFENGLNKTINSLNL
jgi:UDP-glucose 4-epimerase